MLTPKHSISEVGQHLWKSSGVNPCSQQHCCHLKQLASAFQSPFLQSSLRPSPRGFSAAGPWTQQSLLSSSPVLELAFFWVSSSLFTTPDKNNLWSSFKTDSHQNTLITLNPKVNNFTTFGKPVFKYLGSRSPKGKCWDLSQATHVPV